MFPIDYIDEDREREIEELRKQREEKQEKQDKREKLIALLLVTSLSLGSLVPMIAMVKKEKRERKERNASYITEATIDTPYYDWCLNAINIDTIVCFVEGKAYLYEFDEGRDEFLENLEKGVYKVRNNDGKDQYIPTAMAVSFPTHEEAEEYAKQIVGEENIVCANYPKHNSAKTRKLVP